MMDTPEIQDSTTTGHIDQSKLSDQDLLTAKYIDRAKPGDLRRLARRLGFRTVIDGRRFDPPAFVDGQHGFTPEQILRAARHKTHMRLRHLPEVSRRRVRYILSQLTPQGVRDAIHNKGLQGLTILAGGKNRRFPRGIVYWPLEALKVMTFSMRRGWPNDAGLLTDHFDVRLHTMQLDKQSGVIYLGGSYKDEKGQPYSRTALSRDFSREPGRSHQAVPKYETEVVDAALALHEALETAAVSADMGYQRLPILPRVYLGFKDAASALPAIETTTASLRRTAMSFVLKWMRKGLALDPASAALLDWQRSVIPQLMTIDPDSLEDWASLSDLLGPSNSIFLLNQMLTKSISQFRTEDGEDLELLPASYFSQEVLVAVMPSVEKVYVRVNDHLGRDVFRHDGSVDTDRRYGRLQVMQLVEDSGEIGNVKFDFTSTEVGKEQDFS